MDYSRCIKVRVHRNNCRTGSPKSNGGRVLGLGRLPGLGMTNSWLLKMAIEIGDFPIKNGDFP
jgi:hypothetical protein